jgi:hypothetical protein
MADAPQNSVTRDDLRDALAHPGPRRRPTGLLSARPEEHEHEPASRRATTAPGEPAWDWDAGPGAAEQLELEELRELTAEQRRHIDELVSAHEAAADSARELRDALTALAAAGPLGRRPVVRDLRRRGLI